tara:strand:+ start:2744 stop:4096 length:1353 start_codon:yes stop_codon:yes gene_type:complete
MTQSNVDDKFLNGLHLMIDSIESSYLQKADRDYDAEYGELQEPYDEKMGSEVMGKRRNNPRLGLKRTDQFASGPPENRRIPQQHGMMTAADEDDLPEADHWCPDVQEWHTSDHESAKAPSVHVNVDSDNGDDPYQTENGSDTGAWDDASKDEDLEKISVAATLKDVEHGRDRIESEYDQNTNLDRHEQENSSDSIAEPFLNRYAVRDDEEEEEEEGEDVEKAEISPDIPYPSWVKKPEMPEPKPKFPGVEPKPGEPDPRERKKKLDLPGDTQPRPLEMSLDKSNDFIESLVQTHAKSIDILKIWGSVDRVLPKTSSDVALINDIDILKSFDLDETTNIEDLIEGTLVHKMLVDRASRPTMEWWESSMLMAKSIAVVEEPAFFSAFLYYEPDTFDVTDFIDLSKAEVTHGKPQDLEEMPNSSGGSAIDGLGMSADGIELCGPGPEDEDCDK